MVFIQNSEGKFLIQKRSKIKNGKYATTDGHPKSGEDSIQGIISEVKEEIFNRIRSLINDVESNNINKNTLVVTHGGPIRMIKYYLDNGDNFNDKKYLNEYLTININNLEIFIIDEKMNFKKYDL